MTTFQPQHLKRWTHPANYVGAVWPNYYGSGFGRSRDSDDLEESNFAVVQRELAKLPAWKGDDSRMVIRESHWAVGWVEWIAIHQDDEAALRLCDDLRHKANDYPPLDENDWSEREQESANTVWRDCFTQEGRSKYVREHRRQFEFHGLRDAIGCLRGDYFAGHAGEFLS